MTVAACNPVASTAAVLCALGLVAWLVLPDSPQWPPPFMPAMSDTLAPATIVSAVPTGAAAVKHPAKLPARPRQAPSDAPEPVRRVASRVPSPVSVASAPSAQQLGGLLAAVFGALTVALTVLWKARHRRAPMSRQEMRMVGTTGTANEPPPAPVVPGHELEKEDPRSGALVQGRPGPLTEAEISEFYETGVVVVRGLLTGALLERAMAVRRDMPAPLFDSEFEALTFKTWDIDPVFADIALASPVAEAAAQLMPAVAAGREGMHVIRDAFFCFKGPKTGCGWHVDDAFFWPAARDSPGPGVNVWVALDEVGADGGGLAVAPGSHTAPFLDCREVIRDGQTCQMAQLHPPSAARLEAIRLVPHMQPGDAIVHTRWLFHRTDPFVPGSPGVEGPGIARYSVRYMPASGVLGGVVGFDAQRKPVPGQGRIDEADPDAFPKVRLGA